MIETIFTNPVLMTAASGRFLFFDLGFDVVYI